MTKIIKKGNSYSVLLARDVIGPIYISRLYATMSVRLSVTEVHWRIIANLGFKFRSHFTAHCGRRAVLQAARRPCCSPCCLRADHLAPCYSLLYVGAYKCCDAYRRRFSKSLVVQTPVPQKKIAVVNLWRSSCSCFDLQKYLTEKIEDFILLFTQYTIWLSTLIIIDRLIETTTYYHKWLCYGRRTARRACQ